MSKYRVSIDIGGTFTDFVLEDAEARTIGSAKTSSTPADPAQGVLEGLRESIADPEDVEFIVHGQTVGLNSFLERKGARVLLLMTEGLRDAYSIARHDRKDLYTLQYSKPERLVPRRDTLEVGERLRWDGSVEKPVDEASLAPIIEKIRAEDVKAVAVCLVHAYVNPAHELEVRDILLRECPELNVTLSHEIAREWREYERASSAVLNAYIAPKVGGYLESLEHEIADLGVGATLHVMQSNGGISTAARAREEPVQTLLSGPVGGTIGGAALSSLTDRPNLLCVDMGGTSFDVSLIVDGKPSVSIETELEGLPILLSLVDIHTIGAGGGSLAWLEAGGLRVGPQSAGAAPGPACYGRGGTQPTVTDANLFLGRLDPEYFLGGAMELDQPAAEAALHPLAGELGVTDIPFAEGVLQVINASMADAMRTITVRQGIDPREYSLVAFGGAGPMHAAWLAAELEINEIIIPWSPGTFSAWGMLQTDMRHDLVRTFFRALADSDAGDLVAIFEELESEGAELLADQRVDSGDIYFARSADMRYVGQEYSVNVAIGTDVELKQVAGAFHDGHRIRYGHSTPDAPVELVNLRVAALGRIRREAIPFESPEAGGDPVLSHRQVIFEGESHETPALLRDRMQVGAVQLGPLVIEEQTATTVVPPGYSTQVDELGSLVITRTNGSSDG